MSEYLKVIKEEEFGMVDTLKNLYSVEEDHKKKDLIKNYFLTILSNKEITKPLIIIERALVMNNAMVNFDNLEAYGDVDFIKLFDTKNSHDDLPGLMASYQYKNGIYPLTKIIGENPHLVSSLLTEFCNNVENINLQDLVVKMNNLSLAQLTYLEGIAFYYERKLNATLGSPKEDVKQLNLSFEH